MLFFFRTLPPLEERGRINSERRDDFSFFFFLFANKLFLSFLSLFCFSLPHEGSNNLNHPSRKHSRRVYSSSFTMIFFSVCAKKNLASPTGLVSVNRSIQI